MWCVCWPPWHLTSATSLGWLRLVALTLFWRCFAFGPVRSLLSVSLLEGKAKLVFKAQAKRERGPIGDAERRKQLGLLRDESWAVRIKKGRTATRWTVATGLG